jgi:hypothetical protein
VAASFDGGAITSDAGALLLGQADRAIRLTERLAACFSDTRSTELVQHQIETMVMQRVVRIALGDGVCLPMTGRIRTGTRPAVLRHGHTNQTAHRSHKALPTLPARGDGGALPGQGTASY